MARTTVEDCMQQCDNRFNLAYHVSLRARDIQRKGDQRVDMRDDKALVVALREIKDGLTDVPALNAPPPSPEDFAPALTHQTPVNEPAAESAPEAVVEPETAPVAETETESETVTVTVTGEEQKPAAGSDSPPAFNFGSDSDSDSAPAQQTPTPDDDNNTIGGGGESQSQ